VVAVPVSTVSASGGMPARRARTRSTTSGVAAPLRRCTVTCAVWRPLSSSSTPATAVWRPIRLNTVSTSSSPRAAASIRPAAASVSSSGVPRGSVSRTVNSPCSTSGSTARSSAPPTARPTTRPPAASAMTRARAPSAPVSRAWYHSANRSNRRSNAANSGAVAAREAAPAARATGASPRTISRPGRLRARPPTAPPHFAAIAGRSVRATTRLTSSADATAMERSRNSSPATPST
jgi:hypothetical protein